MIESSLPHSAWDKNQEHVPTTMLQRPWLPCELTGIKSSTGEFPYDHMNVIEILSIRIKI